MSGVPLIWSLVWQLFVVPHPYYMSVTEIEHDARTKEVGIACKIFTDDFELALRDAYKTKMDLYDTIGKPSAKFVSEYVQRHLRVKANGVPLTLQYLGYQIEGEATWSFFEVRGIERVQKLEVFNDLLYESKKEQINMLHVRAGTQRKSGRLTAPETSIAFEF